MKSLKRGVKKCIVPVGVFFLLCAAAGLIFLFWFLHRIHGVPSDAVRKADFEALSQEDYDGVLLSMYTPDAFDGGVFDYFRGVPVIQAFHTFENLADIGSYLDRCFTCNNGLSTVYIGLDPYAVSSLYENHASLYIRDYEEYLLKYVQAYPDTTYEFLLPDYSLEYLRTMPIGEYEDFVAACRNFVNLCIPYDNIRIYFLGCEEWLIANPANYDSAKFCTSDVVNGILARTFQSDTYILRPDNMEERFDRMTKLVQAPVSDYPDLSRWCIVFFGDSILEYNAGSYSVPGVVGGLTGAQIYNCGQGGTPAAEDSESILSFNRMVAHFLEQDTSNLEGMNNYIQGLREYMQGEHDGKKYCFVLNFGLNDYFGGRPVDNTEDSYDVGTYAGALRTGIRTLKEAYPEAEILLMTPTYTIYFSEGEEKLSERGGVLTDYVDAALRVAEDMDVYCINNYADSGIDADSQGQYLADGCHPNEKGAFLLGGHIVEEMEKVTADRE